MVDKLCCVVYRKDYDGIKFLLLHRDNWWNGWELVRGDIFDKECVNDSVIREVNQSTGLNIGRITSINFNYSYEYLKELNYIDTNVSCFVAKASDEFVTLSDEHNYYKWANHEQALKLLEFEEQKKLLSFVQNLIKQ